MARIKQQQPINPPREISQREHLLLRAISITTSDRNAAYGNPEDNFKDIAAYWSIYLTQGTKRDIVITPSDVAYMMILMKTARLGTNPTHYDSAVDIAGYAACAADCMFPSSCLGETDADVAQTEIGKNRTRR